MPQPIFRRTEETGDAITSAEPGVKTASVPVGGTGAVPSRIAKELDDTAVVPPAAPRWASAVFALLGLFFAFLFVRMVWPGVFGSPLKPDASPNGFVRGVSALSLLAIPFLLSFFPLYAAVRGIQVYNEFVEGAKEGFNTILRIIPFLVTMLVAINMFKGAGGIDLLTSALAPVLAPLHFPPELLPLAIASVVICRVLFG